MKVSPSSPTGLAKSARAPDAGGIIVTSSFQLRSRSPILSRKPMAGGGNWKALLTGTEM